MTQQPLQTTKYSIELAIGPAVEHLPIIVRKHPTSRRMIIRYQPLQHYIALTLPRYVSIRQGLHFVEEKRAWLERQIRENVKHIPFAHGQVVPVLGKEYTLCHTGGRGVITLENDRIFVPGEAHFMGRRVSEWLKKTAREEISPLALKKSRHIGVTLKKISLRDTSSRWGSCSHDGNLSFSWRLVLAPSPVLDYVVSHEVAHLAQHNHSQAFWAVVERLCPEYEKACEWLKLNSAILYAYG